MSSKPEQDLLALWKAEEQRPFVGFNFSYFADKWIDETPPWSYEDQVRALMLEAQSVLDIGTGGGEKLLAFRDVWPGQVTVTEGHPPNLQLARDRLEPLGVTVVENSETLEGEMPFDNGAFDLVINRHAAFNIVEMERILRTGGIFLTQQVDGRNLSDLSDAFETKQPWTYFTLDFVLQEIEKTNLVVETAEEWTGQTTFEEIGTLVYYLKAIPWTVPGFSVETHQQYLLKLQRRLEKEKALSFTKKLMLLKAKKEMA